MREGGREGRRGGRKGRGGREGGREVEGGRLGREGGREGRGGVTVIPELQWHNHITYYVITQDGVYAAQQWYVIITFDVTWTPE